MSGGVRVIMSAPKAAPFPSLSDYVASALLKDAPTEVFSRVSPELISVAV